MFLYWIPDYITRFDITRMDSYRDRYHMTKTTRLFHTGRSPAVRLPKAWVLGVDEVELELKDDHIVIRPKRRDLWSVAEECADGFGFPDRMPQSQTGVRFPIE